MSERTIQAFMARGLSDQLSKELLAQGYTLNKLKSLPREELTSLGVPSDAAHNILDDKRPPIPDNVVAKLLHECKWHCCVCREKKSVVLHHIQEWNVSHDHSENNIAVLCLDCHGEAHTKRDLGKNLTPDLLLKHKKIWLEFVKEKDLESLTISGNDHGSDGTQDKIRVIANPTRHGRAQLVEFMVENTTERPVNIVGWYLCHGDIDGGGFGFSEHHHDTFPKRLNERDIHRFLDKLRLRDVHKLSELGVCDSDSNRWAITKANLESFKKTAIEHSFPAHLLDDAIALPESTEGQSIDIKVFSEASNKLPHLALVIEVENTGDQSVLCDLVQVVWDFESQLESKEVDGIKCEEVGHRITCPHSESRTPLKPGSKRKYLIEDEWTSALTSAVSSRVKDGSLCVQVRTATEGGWRTDHGEIDQVVLNVVKSVVKYQADKE